MKFKSPLIPAKLIKRYKRFLADVQLANGEAITVHCPNSGSMLLCQEAGAQVLLSDSENPARKFRYTWEMVRTGKSWVGINTMRPNEVVYEALQNREVPELSKFDEIRREVKYGRSSRVDIWLRKGKQEIFVEIKNVTLPDLEHKRAIFPDAVTERGKKHLEELSRVVKKGHRAVMFYFLNREDVESVAPAREIDPAYAKALEKAVKAGVEIMAYQARITPETITLKKPVPFIMSDIKKLKRTRVSPILA